MSKQSSSLKRQSTIANLLPASSGILQRKCACGNRTVADSECAECAKHKRGLQRKLAIGASDDPLELEADRVADQVMAASAHSALNRAPPSIQRYAAQTSSRTATAPASVESVLASSGRPLESSLRQDMEQRFGRDFSRVRVHSGEAAEQSARDVNANAYTVGHNIVFGANRFAPTMQAGRRLLAHELTHVVQQGSAKYNSRSTPCIQRFAGQAVGQTETARISVDRVLSSSGSPLDALRWDMENRFGKDFSQVSAHSGGSAERLVRDVKVNAATAVNNVVLTPNEFTSQMHAGRRMVAHELTNVFQQPNVDGIQSSSNQQISRQSESTPTPIITPVTFGPYLLPEVVIVATTIYPSKPLVHTEQARRDATQVKFVKVETREELDQRKKVLNQKAQEDLENKARQSQGTIRESGPEAERKAKLAEDRRAQESLKTQFGEFWGVVFWWTRGGGQTGEDSPLWKILPALKGFNRIYPPQAFPTQKLIYKDTRGTVTPTEIIR